MADEAGIEEVEEAANLVEGALKYINKASDKIADVKRVEEVLAFIRNEKVILVKYTGDNLTASITGLNRSANKLY